MENRSVNQYHRGGPCVDAEVAALLEQHLYLSVGEPVCWGTVQAQLFYKGLQELSGLILMLPLSSSVVISMNKPTCNSRGIMFYVIRSFQTKQQNV